jgi:HNH endonuclease
MKHHKYTDEQIEFLRENVKGHSYKEIQEMFNKQFNLNLKITQIGSSIKRYNLSNGVNSKFQKGNKPLHSWQKGQQISVETQFKKGNIPVNYKPVGSERVNADGYVYIKIKDPRTWKPKHNVLWEQHHGPIPKNHCVIFADGDRLNVTIENLILITRSQLLIMNRQNLINENPEFTKTGVLIASVIQKRSKRKKK